MNAIEKYEARADRAHSLLCVGLDSEYGKLPAHYRSAAYPQLTFNQWIISQTHPYVAAYKLNIAFYEARGAQGIEEMALTAAYIKENYPDIFLICDAKRADIDNTNKAYADAIFNVWGFDAVTLHPYLGGEALQPFLQRSDKACIILCRTSNEGAHEIQDLQIGAKSLWQLIAERVCQYWNTLGNCMLVMGATYPEELKIARQIVGDMTFLVPGIGAQGGNSELVVRYGLNQYKKGLIINSSRGIIFSNTPSDTARLFRDMINSYRV